MAMVDGLLCVVCRNVTLVNCAREEKGCRMVGLNIHVAKKKTTHAAVSSAAWWSINNETRAQDSLRLFRGGPCFPRPGTYGVW